MSGQIILISVAGSPGGKPPAHKGPIWMEPAVEPEDAKRFLKMIAGSAAENKNMEALVKRNYIKPEIVRIDLQDKPMLAMAICKAELPEVSNCCTLGTGCPDDPTGSGGGIGPLLGGTPIMEINDS